MNIELKWSIAHVTGTSFPRRSGYEGHGLNGRGPVWWGYRQEMLAEDYWVKSHELWKTNVTD